MWQHLTQFGYKKNRKFPEGTPMSDSITYNKYYIQNYLNLSYTKINSPTKSRQLLSLLARAIIKKRSDYDKKNKYDYSTTFETVKVSSSLTLSTVHSILSPGVTSNILAIVAGTLVLTALVLLAPLLIVVFCLNNTTMTSIFIISCFYICTFNYIILSIISIPIKVIFKYSKFHNINYKLFFRVAAHEDNLKMKNPKSDSNEKI